MVIRRACCGLVAAVVAAAGGAARAGDDFDGGTVIFARGSSLFRVDASGHGETEIAELAARPVPQPRTKDARGRAVNPPPVTVRALRSDAGGTVLLVDLAGKWAWMPLDGSTRSLLDLPCADGPAQLTEDGSAVLCRSAASAGRSIIVELRAPAAAAGGARKPASVTAIDVPPVGARLAGTGAERTLVWTDGDGVWAAPPGDLKTRTRVAQEAPLRGFLASPDGERAIGVFADQIYSDARHTRTAEVLMTIQLDSQGARRKAIRDGVAVEWSHDSRWVLVQDGASACIMRVSGGQYKCWRGFTAASLSSDGRWALVLGNRDGSRQASKSARPAKPGKPAAAKTRPAEIDPQWAEDLAGEPRTGISDEPDLANGPPTNDDVSVAPPSGPLSLYRARLEGAFTDRPALLVKVVDGAAVWIPKAP